MPLPRRRACWAQGKQLCDCHLRMEHYKRIFVKCLSLRSIQMRALFYCSRQWDDENAPKSKKCRNRTPRAASGKKQSGKAPVRKAGESKIIRKIINARTRLWQSYLGAGIFGWIFAVWSEVVAALRRGTKCRKAPERPLREESAKAGGGQDK